MPSLTRSLSLDGPLTFDALAHYSIDRWLGDWSALLLSVTIDTEDGDEVILNRPWLARVYGEDRIGRVESDALTAWLDAGLSDYIAARAEERERHRGVA